MLVYKDSNYEVIVDDTHQMIVLADDGYPLAKVVRVGNAYAVTDEMLTFRSASTVAGAVAYYDKDDFVG